MSEGKKANILYVDDEVNNLISFKACFRREYDIFTAESAAEGFKVLETTDVQVIVTDQRMPVTTGIQFLEQLIPKYPDPIRILLTAFTDATAVIDAINKGQIYRYLQKPWEPVDLRNDINKAVELYNLRKDNRNLIQKLLVANQQLEFIARQNLLS